MRTLALLALMTLAVLPLSAHDHWRDRRPVVVEKGCRPAYRWEVRRFEDRRWDDRWEHTGYYRRSTWRYDCDDDRVILRPLTPPFLGRVDLRFR